MDAKSFFYIALSVAYFYQGKNIAFLSMLTKSLFYRFSVRLFWLLTLETYDFMHYIQKILHSFYDSSHFYDTYCIMG